VAIGADMNVTGHFELRRASFVLTGRLRLTGLHPCQVISRSVLRPLSLLG
jgi:hypothetical protein